MKIAARALRHFALLTIMIAVVLFNVGITAIPSGESADTAAKSDYL